MIELHHHIRILKFFDRQTQISKTKLLDRTEDALCIFRPDPNPRVEILGLAGMAVGCQCVATNNEELDLMRDE